MDAFANTAIATFFLSLRFVPVFAFSPPFTLLRVPQTVRVLLGVAIAFWLVQSFPALTSERVEADLSLITLAFGELFIGMGIALSLQWAFAGIYVVGRSLDIQAGFALALLADPSNQGQMPLIGTVFAYGAAAIFFAIGGTTDMLAVFVESLMRVPLGAITAQADPSIIIAFISTALVISVGLAGTVMLALFMIDLTVAFLSRTLPQMNVLLIGFQVKTMAILATLPLALGFSMAAYLRLIRGALETSARMIPG